MSAYDAALANIETIRERRAEYHDNSDFEKAWAKAKADAAPTTANAEIMARKESGVNNKPYDHLTNTEQAAYNTIKENIESRMFQDVLKLSKHGGVYKVLGERALSNDIRSHFPCNNNVGMSGRHRDNFHCHSAFIIDNHEEIQELKKQLAVMNDAVVVDNHKEIQELRQELITMRSELASLKAASTLDDIDDETEDELEQPVITPAACEPKVLASRAAETRINKENRRGLRGTASMKEHAFGISSAARVNSDRHYEQICMDWLN